MTRRTASRRTAATLQDVADLIGMSKATVSRALNGSPKVTEDTKERVRAAAEQVGYVMNPQARALALGRAEAIAIVFTEPLDEMFADPTYAMVVRGIHEGLAETTTAPFLLQAATSFEQARARRRLAQGNADAVIALTPYIGQELLSSLEEAALPTVLCGQPGARERTSAMAHVYADDVVGARMAAHHLLSCGRRRIAVLSGPEDNPAAVDRVMGYREILDPVCPPVSVSYGAWDVVSGLERMETLLQGDPHIDGMLAASDRIAAGALAALQRHGRRLPEDISVIGFDDHRIATETTPTLTTVHQPLVEQGRQAATLALEMADGAPARDIVLEMSLVRRESA